MARDTAQKGGGMDKEKKSKIFEALQGITYLEWKKLSHAVERSFQAEATRKSNEIKIVTPEKLDRFLNLI